MLCVYTTSDRGGSARLHLNMVKLEAKLHDIFPFLKDKSMKDARAMVKRESVCLCGFVRV